MQLNPFSVKPSPIKGEFIRFPEKNRGRSAADNSIIILIDFNSENKIKFKLGPINVILNE